MSIRPQLCTLLLAPVLAASCVGTGPVDPPSDETPQQRAIAERRRISASGRFAAPPLTNVALLTPATMLGALDIDPARNPTFVSATVPDPEAARDIEHLGIIRPSKGDKFLMLSTGRSGNDLIMAEPGTDFAPLNSPAGDLASFKFTIQVPPQLNRMSFEYTFLSAEAPEYVGSQYNDIFTARISDAGGANREVAAASVNSATFFPASDTRVGTSPFLLWVDDATGINMTYNTGRKMDAGTTDAQRVDVQLFPGALANNTVTIEFEIKDIGDGIVDSAVLIDNISFSAIERIDPYTGNNDTDLFDDNGRIYRDAVKIDTEGTHAHSVAADGVTQLLLRSKVSGPGQATFALPPGDPTLGYLSQNVDTLDWGDAATNVNAVQVGTDWYVFALYRAPDEFGTVDTWTVERRAAAVTMTFTPTVGTAVAQNLEIGIVRPPVLVVPDVWMNCDNWTSEGSIAQTLERPTDPAEELDPRLTFTSTCAEYERTSPYGFDQNAHIVPKFLREALKPLRLKGIAATQVNVIGHGFGGLLARKHIESNEYLRADNYMEGGIDRLIMMNSPQLGSRMADEIVRFRDSLSNDEKINTYDTLRGPKIHIDATIGERSVDELSASADPTSAINQLGLGVIGPRHVPYHIMNTTNGRSVTKEDAANLSLRLQPLYQLMMIAHPLVRDLDPEDPEREKLIFGPESAIFCSSLPPPPGDTTLDDHDLFLTTWEQQGGVDAQYRTEYFFEFDQTNIDTYTHEHFLVSNHFDHTLRLLELLNTPTVEDPAIAQFTTTLPAPGAVARVNSCPVDDQLLMSAQLKGKLPGDSKAPKAIVGTVALSSPAAGTVVNPGGQVTATVATTGQTPNAVLFMGPDKAVIDRTPPFSAALNIPANAAGTVQIRAIGFYTGASLSFSSFVPLTVQIPATLTSIEIVNGDAFLDRPGDTRQLRILGNYSDGVRRNITAANLGTLYEVSSLGPVITVSADGLVTAIGPGNATLAVANGTKLTSITVNVGEAYCGDGVIDAGEQCDDGDAESGDGCSSTCQLENHAPVAVCQSPSVCNDTGACSAAVALGGGSTDPDGDPLSIAQSPAGPYAVGQTAVTVSVSDGDLSSQCAAQVQVNDCEAPAISCASSFTAECTGNNGAVITPPSASATDNCSAAIAGPAAGFRPLGATQLSYAASDAAGNTASCSTTVNVVDTTPPMVEATSPAPIFPANHAYRTINLSQCGILVEDSCGGVLPASVHQAAITCVTSDEPDDAPGYGDSNTIKDIQILDSQRVKLRAERDNDGNGRVYRIHFRVKDGHGNTQEGVCPVTVPVYYCYPGDNKPECQVEDDGTQHQVCQP